MVKPKAKVAIITRTKDRPVLLVRAIKSVLEQSYKDWLHVIINDGGDAKPVDDLVKKYEKQYDGRVLVIHNKTNIGMEAASNKAIKECDSEYVIIHDDDDAWHEDFLSKTTEYIESDYIHDSVAGVVTYMEKVWETIKGKKVIEESREDMSDLPVDMTLWRMCAYNLYAPISFLYKREVFDKIGMYREDFPVLGDWEFNLRFMEHYDIGLIKETLAYYHHRLPGKNDVYSNTVVDSVDKHQYYHDLLCNELMRKDFEENKVGLGHLVNSDHTALQQLVAKERHVTSLEHKADSLEHIANELRNQTEAHIERFEELELRHQELDEKNSDMRAEIRKKDRELRSAKRHVASLDSTVEGILHSTSWKLIAPVRVLKRAYLMKRHLVNPRAYKKILKILKIYGIRGVVQKLSGRPLSSPDEAKQLTVWFDRYKPDNFMVHSFNITQWPEKAPKLSILMAVYNTKAEWLDEAIESVLAQTYQNWELICVNDASTEDHVKKMLDKYASKDNRLKVIHLDKNQGVSGASNEGIRKVEGEFVCLMDHDDVLEPHALHRFAETILEEDPDIIYSDEVVTEEDSDIVESFAIRPQFSYDFYLSHPYFVHFVAIRSELIKKISGFDEDFDVSQDYDLILRALEKTKKVSHVSDLLYRWRTHETSVGHERKKKVTVLSKKALKRHLKNIGFPNAKVNDGKHFNFYDIDYNISEAAKVAIIIPTKNCDKILRVCIESVCDTVDPKTADIFVIDHDSDELDTKRYLKELEKRHTVLPYSGKWNFSAINNFGVEKIGKGKYTHYLFLNNDIEALEPGWLEHMVGIAKRSDVGIVGATLLYPNDQVQHAGVIIGMHGAAEHSHKFEEFKKDGKYNRGFIGSLVANRDYHAVTAACMLMRADVFDEVEGYDERLAVGFGDVDLCLRAVNAGYKVIQDSQAVLIHHESITRGKSQGMFDPHPEDSKLFTTRYRELIQQGDPFYSNILAIDSPRFDLNHAAKVSHDADIRTVEIVPPQQAKKAKKEKLKKTA